MTSAAPPGLRRLALTVLVSLAFSLVYLRQSQATGRLSQDLWYDDITYANDGARRLEVAFGQGVVPFLRTFIQEPPHSPVETTLSLIGLTAFGLTDGAVYAANAILLALMALFLVFYFREERPWLVGLYLLVLLASPLAYRTIADFRPDIAVGFTTAAFAALFLRGVFRNQPQDARGAALLLGLALLTKPSFFAHTLAIAGAVVAIWALVRRSGRLETLAPRSVLVLALGLALALPYYAVHGPAMLHYFWSNTRGGESKLWNFSDAVNPLRIAHHFALDRHYGAFSVVGYTRVAAYLTVLAAGGWLAVQRRWQGLALPGALLAVAFGSLAIISVGRMDNDFFASTFNVAVLLTSFLLVAECARGAGRTPLVVGVLFAAAFLVAGYRNSGLQANLDSAELRHGHSWNVALVQAVQADTARRGLGRQARELRVFVTAVSGVTGPTLEWTARKAGLPAAFSDLHRSESIDELRSAALAAAYVVVPKAGQASLLTFLPASALQEQLLAEFLADPRLERVPAGFQDDADRFFLFANREVLDAMGPVFAAPVASVEGFLPDEGPYPQWSLPMVRWMTSPSARICLRAAAAHQARTVRASLRSTVAGRLVVAAAGQQLASIVLRPADTFEEVSFRAPPAGEATCLDLALQGDPGAETRLVLFRRFHVEESP